MKVFAISALFLGLSSCAARNRNFDYAREPDPRKTEFVIGAADTVKITVWKNPELTTEARVRPDGTITMPLLGDMKVMGRTPTVVKAEVGQRLAQFVKDEAATVTVAVTEVNSYRFTIAGNVERPGIYAAKQYVTVTEAISLAGGPNKFSSADESIIVRHDPNGQIRKVPVNYTEIQAGDHPEANLIVLAGDTIFVP